MPTPTSRKKPARSTSSQAARPARKPARTAKPASRKAPATARTGDPVPAFLASLDAAARADCARLDVWMASATGTPGAMYGKAIVGYGSSVIRYADGREAPWMKMGFSPRKQALVLYGVLGAATPALLARLGKHDTGKGCLYVKRLADVDAGVLERIIRAAAG